MTIHKELSNQALAGMIEQYPPGSQESQHALDELVRRNRVLKNWLRTQLADSAISEKLLHEWLAVQKSYAPYLTPERKSYHPAEQYAPKLASYMVVVMVILLAFFVFK